MRELKILLMGTSPLFVRIQSDEQEQQWRKNLQELVNTNPPVLHNVYSAEPGNTDTLHFRSSALVGWLFYDLPDKPVLAPLTYYEKAMLELQQRYIAVLEREAEGEDWRDGSTEDE